MEWCLFILLLYPLPSFIWSTYQMTVSQFRKDLTTSVYSCLQSRRNKLIYLVINILCGENTCISLLLVSKELKM